VSSSARRQLEENQTAHEVKHFAVSPACSESYEKKKRIVDDSQRTSNIFDTENSFSSCLRDGIYLCWFCGSQSHRV